MFGLNELGETASITVNNFKPFLYILVDDTWQNSDVPEFIGNIKMIIGEKYDNSIIKYRLEKKHKLYGFDNKRTYPFVYIEVENTIVIGQMYNLTYRDTLKYNSYFFFFLLIGSNPYRKGTLHAKFPGLNRSATHPDNKICDFGFLTIEMYGKTMQKTFFLVDLRHKLMDLEQWSNTIGKLLAIFPCSTGF